MHLLDTPVVWALRGEPAPADAPLVEWAAGVMPSAAFISAVTMMEFEAGTARIERSDKASGTALRSWLEEKVRPTFEGRILAVDDAVVRRSAALGYSDVRDGLVAATALEHGLTIATRDVKAFKTGKVRTFNPWTYSPDAAELDWRQASHSAPMWLKSLFVRA
jgi:predicted nucleic acid-binding protein